MFIRFDVIHERVGRTDRQTDRRILHHSKDCACIASRGKNDTHIQLSSFLHYYLLYLLLNTKHNVFSSGIDVGGSENCQL